jgi:hypothetical protein
VTVDKQGIAVRAAGQKAILDPGGSAKSLHEEQPADEEQEENDDCREAGGLPVSGFAVRGVIRMRMQKTLP